ncbi:MAG: hypothetical protein ABH826_03720 [Patescibacteria group bacterium]|nr:hypothetical protein [Patescibacteria group bacterium]
MKKIFKWAWKILAALGSAMIYVLTIPRVRNFLWNKVKKVGKEKIIDAEVKIVEKMKE